MVIHHYVPFTLNVGDLFVRDGIHLCLREQFSGVRMVELPANDPQRRSKVPVGLTGANLERTNAEADLVVVGGSNLYEGPEWRFVTDLESIRALRPPMAFIGLGVGSVRGRKVRPLSNKSVAEIRASHERAIGVAVRDLNTVAWLASLGIKCQMTACPATFVGHQPMRFSPVRRVVVSAPPARFLPKWGHRGYVRSTLMVATFRRVLQILETRGLEFEVIAHDERDVDYLEPMLSKFGRKPLYFGNETQTYYEHFRAADLAICYRLHMAISCLGWGVPFYLINFDLRTEAFRDTYGIGAITYDAFGLGAMRRLALDVCALPSFPQGVAPVFKAMEQRREEFRQASARFYADISLKLAGSMGKA